MYYTHIRLARINQYLYENSVNKTFLEHPTKTLAKTYKDVL